MLPTQAGVLLQAIQSGETTVDPSRAGMNKRELQVLLCHVQSKFGLETGANGGRSA